MIRLPDFSLRLDIHGLPQLVITSGSGKELRSGPRDGLQFGGIPMLSNLNWQDTNLRVFEGVYNFIPKAEDEWDTQGFSGSRKCIEKLSSYCPNGEGFLKLPAMKFPDFNWSNKSMNIKECEAECFRNCSCDAYASPDVTGGGSGCLMWFGELINIRECPAGFIWGQDMFLRVPASELSNFFYLMLLLFFVFFYLIPGKGFTKKERE
ncbi:hypothetical protein LWI28_018127 [Acer negundo]|uniref:Apple domain-containing protein n=1 Tax=Acer negundo TaxID=4023 RepID=A0AAD5J5H0_ACENE|nr:hypothetical protein LWI28_018127 [Acer negundo]